MRKRPIVTQQELARRLGVTQVTVSRALSGKDRLAPETRERILNLAQELGYRVNGLARRIQEGRYRGMALLGSMARPAYNIWDQDFHIAVGNTLAERSWHLTEGWLPAEGLADAAVVEGLLDRMLADLVLIHDVGTQSPEVERILAQHRISPVWVNAGRASDAVDFDDAGGARAGLVHLLEQGYRKPALLLPAEPGPHQYEHCSVSERTRGFVAASNAAGIAARVLYPPVAEVPQATAQYLRQLLASDERPDAVLCYASGLPQVLRLVLGERGLRVGTDLGIISFGKAEDAMIDGPLTICRQDYAALGREAVRLAWRLLETGKPQPQVLIPVPVVHAGASTTR